MDESILSPNDGQETVVESQETVQDTSVENSQVADVKPVQSREERAEFAQVRRDAESKARDSMIAEMYGESHGIKTYADYQKALAEQAQQEANAKFQEEHGVDPESIKPFFEQWKQSDPDFQELNSIRAEKNITKALTELNDELKENGIDLQLKDLSDEEVAKIPNCKKVEEYVTKGHSLADAVFLANKKEFIARQAEATKNDVLKKISSNGNSSPGSLTGGVTEDEHITLEAFEANRNNQLWVRKNLPKIQKSREKW